MIGKKNSYFYITKSIKYELKNMKIASLNLPKINFTSQNSYYSSWSEEDELGNLADDWGGSKIRDAIRNHMYPQFIFDDNSSKKLPSNVMSIEDVFVPNLQNIGSGSYRGASLSRNTQYLDLLARSGVKTIIDLVGFKKLQDACAEKNLKYYKYEVPHNYWLNPIFIDNQELLAKRTTELAREGLSKSEFNSQIDYYKNRINIERAEYMEKFIGLIDTMKKGFFYIGCDLGECRTPNLLALNSYFNPDWQGEKIPPTNDFVLKLIKNMYKNMTDDDKERLGFTKEFDEKLRSELDIKNEGN